MIQGESRLQAASQDLPLTAGLGKARSPTASKRPEEHTSGRACSVFWALPGHAVALATQPQDVCILATLQTPFPKWKGNKVTTSSFYPSHRPPRDGPLSGRRPFAVAVAQGSVIPGLGCSSHLLTSSFSLCSAPWCSWRSAGRACSLCRALGLREHRLAQKVCLSLRAAPAPQAGGRGRASAPGPPPLSAPLARSGAAHPRQIPACPVLGPAPFSALVLRKIVKSHHLSQSMGTCPEPLSFKEPVAQVYVHVAHH